MNKKDLKLLSKLTKKEQLYYYSLISFHIDFKIPLKELELEYSLNEKELLILKEFINKINNNDLSKIKEDITLIINHLNNSTGKKLRLSKIAEKNIKQIFNLRDENNEKFITVEDFYLVNDFFSKEWDNPKLKKYLVPGTLYNSKFLERLDQAKEYFNDKNNNNHDDNFDKIVDFYKNMMISFSLNINFMNFEKSKKHIKYWLNNNYSLDDCLLVVNEGLKELYKLNKIENMSLNFLFNSSFPKKYERAKLLAQKSGLVINELSKSSKLAIENSKW